MQAPFVIARHAGITRRIIACFIACAYLLPCSAANADVVGDWNVVANATAAAAGRAGAAVIVDLAYVHAAIYDAVNAIDGRHAVYAVSPRAVHPGASADAAAVSAAYRVLLFLYPSQRARLDAAYATSLAQIVEGPAKSDGISVGEEVATLFLASRAGDGRNAAVPYTPGSGPGVWIPTPPAFAAASVPWLAKMSPFALTDPWQFRADPPPDLTSETWAADYNETKTLGDLHSFVRTAEQTDVGLLYANNPVPSLYPPLFRWLVHEHGMDTADSARFFAMVYIALADGYIAVWDSKFAYNRWRPVTAIRAGDTDGNELTDPDDTWTPLATTPNHPEYPAAHGAITGAVAETLHAFFGTKRIELRLVDAMTGTIHFYDSTDDLLKESIVARIYGGMHFRTSCVRGIVIGRKVAHWLAKQYFQPIRSK
jgi:hypothetical protein